MNREMGNEMAGPRDIRPKVVNFACSQDNGVRRKKATVSLPLTSFALIICSFAAFGLGVGTRSFLARNQHQHLPTLTGVLPVDSKSPDFIVSPKSDHLETEPTWSINNNDVVLEKPVQHHKSSVIIGHDISNMFDFGAGKTREVVAQHLFVELRNICGSFLSSGDKLSRYILELAENTDLRMQSSRCYDTTPSGFTCVSILSRGHLVLHASPSQGAATIDIFTSGTSLESLGPAMESKLDVLGGDSPENVAAVSWSLKQRGQSDRLKRRKEKYDLPSRREVPWTPILSNMTYVGSHNYTQSMQLLPQLDRNAVFYEAMVHPAMFTHDEPEYVLIFGGASTGAILKEVLKHETVELVVILEADKGGGHFSRQHLAEWSDCSDLIDSTANCFDDPVVERHDFQWFLDSVEDYDCRGGDYKEHNCFDVIIVDPLKIDEDKEIVFAQNAHKALLNSGVLAGRLNQDYNSALLHHLVQVDPLETFKSSDAFSTIRTYEEYDSAPRRIWNYIVAFKHDKTRGRWFSSQGKFDLHIRRRLEETKSGVHALQHFDGAKMESFQFPSRTAEDKYCEEKPAVCEVGHGFNPEIQNAHMSSFEVKSSTVPDAGRGVFTKKTITAGSYIAIDECIHVMYIPDSSVEWIDHLYDQKFEDELFDGLEFYTHGYGFANPMFGLEAVDVDPGIGNFVNHGCNGTENVGENRRTVLSNPLYKDLYNPFLDRTGRAVDCSSDTALRNIDEGEELFTDYALFANDEEYLQKLDDICGSQGVLGMITAYERGASNAEDFLE